jgi:ABC-type sugar transport system substrate-binding protein
MGCLITILVDREKLEKKSLPSELHPILKPQYTKAKESDVKSGLLNAIAAIYNVLEKHRPKPIVLISSTLAFLGKDELSTEGLDYFTTLVMAIIQRLKTVNRDVILKVPIYSDSTINPDAADNQKQLLDETVAHLSDYSGIIIAPFDLESLQPGIVTLLKRHPDFPFATIDKSYEKNDAYFQANGVVAPAGFVCDGRYNGRLAALSLIRYIRHTKIINPNIIVIQGLQGSTERVDGLLVAVTEYNQGKDVSDWINVFVSKTTEFIQAEGDKRATDFLDGNGLWDEYLDQAIMPTIGNCERSGRPVITGFFCCNDELALGVRNCLERRTQVDGRSETSVIVGFDGISTVKKHIQNLDPWLLDSIDVKIGQQVRVLVRNFVEALTHEIPVPPAEWFKGELLDKQPLAHFRAMGKFRSEGDPETIA